jgi:hypothetical protein
MHFSQRYRSVGGWLRHHLTAGQALLAIALACGGVIRFTRLDTPSMTADEGAAWAAAVQPVTHLLKLQPQLDSGKLALYDLLLHYWILVFGDSLRSMRGLSAAIDTISILLLFAVIGEMYQAFAREDLKTAGLAGGFAALMFAFNVAITQSARTARMYPLMSASELAQVWFFIRAQKSKGLLNCILAGVFLAIAIAANFTGVFLLVGECTWIGYLLLARWRHWHGAELRVTAAAFSVAAGIGLLLPFVPAASAASKAAIRGGALDWIRYQPPLGWIDHVLREGIGNKSLYRLYIALAAFGIWRLRRKAPLVPIFLTLTIAGPFAGVVTLSLLGRPMMVDRYVNLALIMFLGLAATGAAAFQSSVGRILVLFLVIWLSVRALKHSSEFWVDWKKAAEIACARSAADASISVTPAYAVNAVRYHLPPQRRPLAFGLASQCGESQVLIVNPGHLISPASLRQLNACYPHLLGQATRVEVRTR